MKGAALGEASSEAAVGQLYEAGNQVAEDWGVAAQWYAKSAQQGNRVGEFRLGRAYEYGVGVPLDLGTAVQWYDKAAAQGDSQGAILAKYIRDNHGVDVSSYSDEEKAVIAPYEMQPWMLRVPPSGRAFRNTGERMAYFQTWAAAAADYENCLSAHANASTATCPAPVPPN
jgi:TPR repeat protein